MISDMAQNNPTALQALQKEFGAGMTTKGQKIRQRFGEFIKRFTQSLANTL